MSQRHSNDYGFVKSRSAKNEVLLWGLGASLPPLGRLWVPFWRPLNFERGFKIDNFWKQIEKINEVQEVDWTKHCKKKKVFELYMLQNMSLLGVVEHKENWCQKKLPKRSKSITLAASGLIFEILGGFPKLCFFEDFWIGKKLVFNLPQGDFKRARAILQAAFGRVGE